MEPASYQFAGVKTLPQPALALSFLVNASCRIASIYFPAQSNKRTSIKLA